MKILYVVHISWGWIKQRPQFIAEELSKECQIDVLYRKSNHFGSKVNPKFKNNNLCVEGFRNWPFERFQFIPCNISHQINKLIWKLKNIDLNSYDYVWITDPVLWWTIKDNFTGTHTKLIYDCMDDLLAFPYFDSYPKYKIFNELRERELLKDADFVFCSALSLRDKLFKRYRINRDYYIINNAITDNITKYSDTVKGIDLPPNSLVYIGTISEWFDFDNTLKILDEFPTINVVLYGPQRMPTVPKHERLHFKGPTEHDNILAIMRQSCGLIMPFIVSDLIESVNPVKLYEYIYSGKPVLASRYGESLAFDEYVSLYSSYEEYKQFVINCLEGKQKRNASEMKEYAIQNTWLNRSSQIKEIIGLHGKI